MDNTNTTNSASFANGYIHVVPGTVTVSPAGFPAQTVQGTPPADVTETGSKAAPAADSVLPREPATIDFGFKADPVEVEIDGETGLLCKGFASKYNETDAVGEEQLPGAFRAFGEEWFAQREPLVLFQHGMDGALGARPIGRGLDYKMLPDGVYVEAFVPKNADEGWQDKRAKKRFAEVYNGIKTGSIRGFSVGGAFTRFGKKLANWATVELSITPIPCLASATFALGSKAVIDRYGAVPMGLSDQKPQEQNTLGVLTRAHWNAVMGLAKQDMAHSLHDHLMGYDPAMQGKHDSEDCPLCQDRRAMMGVKGAQEDDMDDGLGRKSVWTTAKVNDFPDSSFAYVEPGEKDSEGKTTPRSKRHLPYKDASGKPDAAHVRNALARLNQADIPDAAKSSALKKLKSAAHSLGIEVSDEGSGGKSDLDAQEVMNQATEFLEEFGRSVKAGRRHSKETRAAVSMVVEHLQKTFQIGPHDPGMMNED